MLLQGGTITPTGQRGTNYIPRAPLATQCHLLTLSHLLTSSHRTSASQMAYTIHLIPTNQEYSPSTLITKTKNASWRTSKRQDARNSPVRPVHREQAVLYLGALRKCQWILRHVPIWPTSTSRTRFFYQIYDLIQFSKMLLSECNNLFISFPNSIVLSAVLLM